MQWGPYEPGRLVPAQFGLREPQEPWLAAEAVADATAVLVPALAVDRAGARLGRGAGYYDRALALADPAARLVAVVRDDELVDEIPAEAHDVADDPRAHAAPGTRRTGVVQQRASTSSIARFSFLDTQSP